MKDKITEIKINGKTTGYYGKRISQTAQEIIDEVSEELNKKQEVKQNGNTR